MFYAQVRRGWPERQDCGSQPQTRALPSDSSGSGARLADRHSVHGILEPPSEDQARRWPEVRIASHTETEAGPEHNRVPRSRLSTSRLLDQPEKVLERAPACSKSSRGS